METVTVRVTDEAGNASEVRIPARNRDAEEMGEILGSLVADYLSASIAANEPMSLGDFALYSIARAYSVDVGGNGSL